MDRLSDEHLDGAARDNKSVVGDVASRGGGGGGRTGRAREGHVNARHRVKRGCSPASNGQQNLGLREIEIASLHTYSSLSTSRGPACERNPLLCFPDKG